MQEHVRLGAGEEVMTRVCDLLEAEDQSWKENSRTAEEAINAAYDKVAVGIVTKSRGLKWFRKGFRSTGTT